MSPTPAAVTPKFADCRYEHSKGVVGTRQNDTTVLLDANAGLYYTLNEVGGRLWELLGSGLPFSAIVARLEDEYDVPRATLAADAAAHVNRLLAAKLIGPAQP